MESNNSKSTKIILNSMMITRTLEEKKMFLIKASLNTKKENNQLTDVFKVYEKLTDEEKEEFLNKMFDEISFQERKEHPIDVEAVVCDNRALEVNAKDESEVIKFLNRPNAYRRSNSEEKSKTKVKSPYYY